AEREYRVWSGFELAVDRAREMDSEKREAWIGNRIDEVSHERPALRPDHEVFAAERHDTAVGLFSGQPGDAIGVQPRAIDERVGAKLACVSVNAPAAFVSIHPTDAGARLHDATHSHDLRRERFDDAAVVDDAFFGHVHRGDATNVWLALGRLGCAEP